MGNMACSLQWRFQLRNELFVAVVFIYRIRGYNDMRTEPFQAP